jgi:hypothetical protein
MVKESYWDALKKNIKVIKGLADMINKHFP